MKELEKYSVQEKRRISIEELESLIEKSVATNLKGYKFKGHTKVEPDYYVNLFNSNYSVGVNVYRYDMYIDDRGHRVQRSGTNLFKNGARIGYIKF